MKVFGIIFTVMGIAMLIGALLMFNSTRSFVSEANLAKGTVTELLTQESRDSNRSSSTGTSVTYTPVGEFTTAAGENITYVSSSSSNPPSHQLGERLDIYYLAANPQRAKIDDFIDLWFGTVTLSILGGVFFLVGFIPNLYVKISAGNAKSLLENGIALETTYQSVEHNTSLKVNGRSPYKIVTHWQNPDTTQLHIFKSNNIWFDPSDYILQDKITVYVSPDNYKKYYLDTSFLPTVA